MSGDVGADGPPNVLPTQDDVGAGVAAVIESALRDHGWLDSGDAEDAAREIAPLIAERAEAAKAEALREAANALFAIETDDFHKMHPRDVVRWLRDRAAALDPGLRR